jgi:hypothetical protein
MSHAQTAHSVHDMLHHLAHHLPSQAPLKDFIHHNTLHSLQHMPFHEAMRTATVAFGYRTYLPLAEYRAMFQRGVIRPDVLDRILSARYPGPLATQWRDRMLNGKLGPTPAKRIGSLRANWKFKYQIDLDSQVHPILFRVVNSFLDQGISMWHFPVWDKGLLDSLREMERLAMTSLFHTPRARKLMLDTSTSLEQLLHLIVGDEALWERYLYDQQFAHPGWSGMVAVLEQQPEGLLDRRTVCLHDLVAFELLLEIDALDRQFGEIWMPLSGKVVRRPHGVLDEVRQTDLDTALMLWQEAFEWSYYDDVLAGIVAGGDYVRNVNAVPFQLVMCIDDRSCSVRRYVEAEVPGAQTFGTPGFFAVDTYYRPAQGRHNTKVCPAPVTPKHLIKEVEAPGRHKKDVLSTKRSHGLFSGWFIAQTVGFWSALRLILNIFRPTATSGTALAVDHVGRDSSLTVEHKGETDGGLQVGYTIPEMADRVQNMLTSIGLNKDFAPLIYIVGHGSSSINNTHYSAYDCGACSGRPGSLNARAFCHMANHAKVRAELRGRGFSIPEGTVFVAGLHDTSRDEFIYYGVNELQPAMAEAHARHAAAMERALDLNAKERSRRFESIDTHLSPAEIHRRVKIRTVSLFEPRPELNHATNSLCIVGRRTMTDHVFLDRRAFLNSYDPYVDPTGKYLLGILNAAAPVCGGINLEYYFSRVDNNMLGAGTKLPHNVMGLIGVANGMEGDLRPGLPVQMIEVHDPVRLLMVVEQRPEVVLSTIRTNPATYEWFEKEWVHLVAIDPDSRGMFRFSGSGFVAYAPLRRSVPLATDLNKVIESTMDNIPVMVI